MRVAGVGLTWTEFLKIAIESTRPQAEFVACPYQRHIDPDAIVSLRDGSFSVTG
jgi:hypothetical protein